KQKANAARLQSELESVAIGQGLMINGAPHPNLGSITNPQHKDHPAIWQSFFCNYHGHQKPLPRGLDRDHPQAPVSDNLLRVFLGIGRLTSQLSSLIKSEKNGSVAVFRMRMFRILAIEGEYRRIVRAHSIQIASPPLYQLDERPPFVVTDQEVGVALARMGY